MSALFAFKTAFILGTLADCFSGSFAERFHQVSWRRCHSSSGFILSQFVHVIPDRLNDDEIRSLCGAYWLLKAKGMLGNVN